MSDQRLLDDLDQSDGPVCPPTLPAYPSGKGTWRVWCDWCRRWHIHSTGEGHRVAHCPCRNSPYRARGYVLAAAHGPAPKRRQKPGYMCGGTHCPCKPARWRAQAG